ncbi:hypothetical protein [Halovivax asiaticus]|nr:hypothetical protein [Halovivax asiaticus]
MRCSTWEFRSTGRPQSGARAAATITVEHDGAAVDISISDALDVQSAVVE